MPPASPHRAVSLSRTLVWRIWLVVFVFVGGIALSQWLAQRDAQAERDARLEQQLDSLSLNLTRRLAYKRSVVDALARDPATADLLRFGDVDMQQTWAQTRQRLLPDALGLALIDNAGRVLGDHGVLRVGPQCMADLEKPGRHAGQLLVHDDMPGLAHVDIVSEVLDVDGSNLGRVFLSLRLTQLQRILDESTYPGFTAQLTDASGKIIVGQAPAADARVLRQSLADTGGWMLTVGAPPLPLIWRGTWQALTLLGILLILLLITTEGVLSLRRHLIQDLQGVRDSLSRVSHGEASQTLKPHYREFDAVMDEINQVAQELDRQRALLTQLSQTDTLTGLPNRRAFENAFARLHGLAARGHTVALVLFDVDHFKSINDGHGHAVGDKALVALANSLTALTRSTDLPARLAGDEFVVMLVGLDAEGAASWYNRLIDRFSAELRALGVPVEATTSAGHTWLLAADTLGHALSRADRALYRAKQNGRGQMAFGEGDWAGMGAR